MPAPQFDILQVDHLKTYSQQFVLSPKWRDVGKLVRLNWARVKFEEKSHAHLPKQRGIYAFIVAFDHQSFPTHGYVMYVGITGNTSTHRTLHARFGDYLREKQQRKRQKIYYMLDKYKQDLYFHFAVVDNRVNLGLLEQKLNDAFIPPMSINDFSATLRKSVRAFR